MKKLQKCDLEMVPLEMPGGFAHGLNLLLLAIGRTNPAAGSLLDEFTSLHAEYLAGLRALESGSVESSRMLESFLETSKSIYQRLRALDDEQSATRKHEQESAAVSLRVH